MAVEVDISRYIIGCHDGVRVEVTVGGGEPFVYIRLAKVGPLESPAYREMLLDTVFEAMRNEVPRQTDD